MKIDEEKNEEKLSSEFEDAFKELESIVERFEHGEMKLDESLALFERGTILAKYCARRLDEAEKKIQELLVDEADTEKER